MILLFNKVYLEVDYLLQTSVSRIVISQTYGNTMVTPSRFGADQKENHTVDATHQATDLTSLLDESFGGDITTLFTYLLKLPPDVRTVVYCDSVTMRRLLLVFWRTLFVKAGELGFRTLWNSTISQIIEAVGIGYSSLHIMSTDSITQIRRDYQHWLTDDAIQEAYQEWTHTQPLVLSRNVRETLLRNVAMEMQLPTSIQQPNWGHRKHLEDRVVRAMRKMAIQDFIDDVRPALLEGLVCFHHFVPTTQYDFFTHTLADLVAMHPAYRFLTDELFSYKNVDYILSAYSLSELRQVQATVVGEDSAYFIDASPLWAETLTLDDILNMETSNNITLLFGKRGFLRDRVNQYLTDAIFQAVRQQQTQLLEELSLV